MQPSIWDILCTLTCTLVVWKLTLPTMATMYHILFNLYHKLLYYKEWSRFNGVRGTQGYKLLQAESHMFIASTLVSTLFKPSAILSVPGYIQSYHDHMMALSRDHVDEINELNDLARKFSASRGGSIVSYIILLQKVNPDVMNHVTHRAISMLSPSPMFDTVINMIPKPTNRVPKRANVDYDIEKED